MTDKLIDKGGHRVVAGEIIMDQIGREWQYSFCSESGMVRESEQIFARRITNGRAAAKASAFKAEFFPDYQIKDEFWEPSEIIMAASLEG